jgi:hypothetical protein
MKYIPIVVLIFSTMALAGCAEGNYSTASRSRRSSPSDSSLAGGIDPVTQAGIDASNAATDEQSRADTQAAFDAISAANSGQ